MNSPAVAGLEEQALNLFPSFDSIESVLWPALGLAVFVATAVFVDLMVLLASRWRLVDLPNRRSAHALPTARGGGVAIVLFSVLATLTLVLRYPPSSWEIILGVLVPCVVIACVGVIDDIQPLRAILRLAIQLGVAAWMITVLGPIQSIAIPGFDALSLGPFAWPLTVLWIVGMINAFNFMDGADGMAGLGAVVAGTCVAAIGFVMSQHLPMLMAAFIAAAAGGFLVFNWHPARVFMGDVGSGFLGAMFAVIPLAFSDPARAFVLLPVAMSLWPYIFDPLVSVVRRLVNRANPLEPHREFFFHRLVRSGLSHSFTAWLYGMLALCGGLAGLTMLVPGVPQPFAALAPVVPLILAGLLAWRVERRCARVPLDSGRNVVHSLSNR